tara:strand:- start:329 stop:508 length:180 start_codon:yes stop_codon:yes gene_type:complete
MTVMTVKASIEKHQAFNEVLKLMNSSEDLMNSKLFNEIVELTKQQADQTQRLIDLKKTN